MSNSPNIKKRKKIAFVTLKTFSGIGGIEQFNKYVVKCLQNLSENFEIAVFSAYDKKENVSEEAIKNIKFKGYNENKVLTVIDTVRLAYGYDIVLLGHVLLWPIGKILHILNKNTKWYFFVHGMEVWTPLPPRYQKALQTATGILSVSQYTANEVAKLQGVAPNKIQLFYNALDKERLKEPDVAKVEALRHQYKITKENTVFITVSRMKETEHDKGYPLAILGMANLVKQHPNAKHILVGTITPEEKEYVLRLISENHLENNVFLAGYVSDDDLPHYYGLADVFVMPSKKEGFGIVFIEAAWYGLQVIAGNLDGSVEALLHGSLGVLVNPLQQQEINNAMIAQMGFKKSDERMKQNRALIQAQFSIEKMQERLSKFLLQQSH